MASAVLCTEPFTALGTAEAKGLGLEKLDILSISHPLGGIPAEKVTEKADVALEELENKLSRSAPTKMKAE